MPIGVILLLAVAILIYFGFLQRVLDRMHMNDKTAFIFIGAMIVGSFLPNIPLGFGLSINIGGGVVPIAIAVYLIVTAKSNQEKVRSIIAALVTGVAIYAAGRLLPAEPGTMIIDPTIAFSLLAGIIAYVFGRSRRGAFIAGIFGIIISDIIYAFGVTTRPVGTVIGGAGIFDGAVLAGIIAVALCEIIGETGEKLQGGSYAKKQSDKETSLSSMLVEEEDKPVEEGEDRDDK